MNAIKNIKNFSAIVLLVLMTNCSLDEEVYTFISKDEFYNNGEEALAGVDGVYATLDGMFNQSAIIIGDLPTHIGYSDASGGADWELFESLQYDSFSGSIDALWNNGYKVINQTNGLLATLPEIENIEEDFRKRLTGETQFLRALAYFTLVRTYKNVVYRTEETTSLENLDATNQGTEQQVYDLIINDLKSAESSLPSAYSGRDIGRATSGAAKALLAKVYLQRSGMGMANEYDLAAAKAKEVMDAGTYQLWQGNYGDLWLLDNENKPEYGSIFEIQFTGGITNNGLWSASGSGGNGTVYEGYRGLAGDPNFYESWDKTDGRYEGTWYTEMILNGDTVSYPSSTFVLPATVKYKAGFTEAVPDRLGTNIKVLRYADVLLMHSEAVNEAQGPVAEAYTGVNQVRERAGLAPLSGLSQEELREAIRRERELELAFEGHSLFDLQRYGVDVFLEKVQVRYPNADAHLMIMPIPQREVDNNEEIVQNEGY